MTIEPIREMLANILVDVQGTVLALVVRHLNTNFRNRVLRDPTVNPHPLGRLGPLGWRQGYLAHKKQHPLRTLK